MNMQTTKKPLFAVSALAALMMVTGAAWAHDEVIVAGDGAGKLAVHKDLVEPLALTDSIGGLSGLSGFPAGLTTIIADEPGEGLFALPSSADIEFVLAGSDAGLIMLLDGLIPMNLNDSYELGNPYFHNHPIWNVASPVFGQTYTLTGFFRDRSGALADSDEFTLTFTPVPAPGAAGLLALAGLAMSRRRRA